jgi:methylglutaconyl-CoA hydratase
MSSQNTRVRLEHHAATRYAAVGEIVIDRPDKRNALTPEMIARIIELARELDADPSCGAVVLRGEGEVFCAGFDLSLCKDNSDALAAMLRGLSEACRVLRGLSKPVVVAARGAAIAGGCALVCSADFVVTDQSAKLGYPVVRLGISPAVNAPMVVRRIGAGHARTRLLDWGLVSGAEALRLGLADLCVDLPDDVIPRAQIEAAKFADKPRGSVADTKRWLNEVDGSGIAAEIERGLAVSLALVGSAEERERLAGLWRT